MRGFLVAIEGIDGSGKTTQIELLKQALEEKGVTYEVISFPRYGQNLYAELVGDYLSGQLGNIEEINPYLISLAYSGDRMLVGPQMRSWIDAGKVVIANRYVASSKAHLGTNLPEDKRTEFIKWLDELEYETNGVLREDLTILLVVNPKVGQKNVEEEHKPDIHEQNLGHLEEANKIYLQLAKEEPNWYVVNCMSDGQMRPKVKIHQQILQILSKKFPS